MDGAIHKHMMDVVPYHAIAIGLDRKVIYANISAKKIFGDIQDKPCFEALYARSSPCEDCPLNTESPESVDDTVKLDHMKDGHLYRRRALLRIDGKIEGLLEYMHDMGDYQYRKDISHMDNVRLKKQSEMKDMLMDIIPILTRKVGAADRDRIIMDIGDRIESFIESRMASGKCNHSMLSCACISMNEMGGNFVISQMDGYVEIVNDRCPWGEDAANNPFLCNITRMIFSRALNKENMQVDLLKSIGNHDDICMLRAYKKL